MQQCSAWMRRPPFRRWIAWIRCCRFLPVVLNVMDSSTTAMEHCPCMPPWTRPPSGVHGKTPAHHTSRGFVAFLKEVVSLCPRHKQIHIILDNLSAPQNHFGARVPGGQNPRVHFHFTPTYSSWLNQVELWFARIEPDVITRGIFNSVSDLARKLRRYINACSANARPFQWKYSDPSPRIRSNEFTAIGH